MKLDVSKLKFFEVEQIASRLERKGASVSLKRQGGLLLMIAN